ncbi:Uncharacterised protein [Mycobacterium tuberculosis]|nr:Uncharacterised protein [Mycobacterium tuberculosis]
MPGRFILIIVVSFIGPYLHYLLGRLPGSNLADVITLSRK